MSTYTLDEARRAVESATKQMVEEIVAVLGKLEPKDLATLVEELDAGNIPVVKWQLPRNRLRVLDASSATEGRRRKGRPVDPVVQSRREENERELQERMDRDILRCLEEREKATIQYIAGNIGASAGMTAKALDRLIGWGRVELAGQEDGKTLYARS